MDWADTVAQWQGEHGLVQKIIHSICDALVSCLNDYNLLGWTIVRLILLSSWVYLKLIM